MNGASMPDEAVRIAAALILAAAALPGLAAGAEQRQQQASAAGKPPPAQRSQPILRPDGSTILEADDEDLDYVIITRNADGTTATRCVKGAQAARAAIAARARARTGEPEHRDDQH